MKHRTMQGKEIDMDKLMQQHELAPAIGNMKVNARGDELGPGGKIVRRREDVVAAYYESNPKAAPSQNIEKIIKEDKPATSAPIVKNKKTQQEE